MLVYFDESGDLGWKFNKPYQHGGSSRYFTIAFLFIDDSLKYIPERIMRNLYKKRKQSPRVELKGSQLKKKEKTYFTDKLKIMLQNNKSIKLAAITVKKENVFSGIREDKNLLYNYMTKLVIPDYIKDEAKVDLYPDPRSIKIKSTNCLRDYLQTYLLFELHTRTKLYKHSVSSSRNLNIQFADVLANMIWGTYEKENPRQRIILSNIIDNRELFFEI